MKIEISKKNYEGLEEIKEKTESESLDEAIEMLLDFWYSFYEKAGKISK